MTIREDKNYVAIFFSYEDEKTGNHTTPDCKHPVEVFGISCYCPSCRDAAVVAIEEVA